MSTRSAEPLGAGRRSNTTTLSGLRQSLRRLDRTGDRLLSAHVHKWRCGLDVPREPVEHGLRAALELQVAGSG
jgi:hypothetical protein